MRNFAVVVAATASNWGIGKNGNIPWKLSEDMKFFKDLTSATKTSAKKNAVIMGRKTYESIPSKMRPLVNRINVVVTRNPSLRESLNIPDDVLIVGSLQEALKVLENPDIDKQLEQVFIIGGESIYRESLTLKECAKIYLTSIEQPNYTDLDTYFPIIPANKFHMVYRSNIMESKDIKYRFTEYESLSDDPLFITTHSSVSQLKPTSLYIPESIPNYEEQQYLDIVKDILHHGVCRGDRTGTGTLSKFGVQMRFNLRNNTFPLLTTKKVFWRGVVEELLWFVKGSTNANELKEKNIHIWDGNGSKEFLNKLGFCDRDEGDLGPVYGFQWRHFGAVYKDMYTDYTNQGIDQLKDCIHRIKTTPDDRRIVLTAWNPSDISKMALPPCHMFCQFYVANGELSCQMYQRSADMGLGVPFNIASYSLLTAMIAQVCGLQPGDFVHTIGDAHIYVNHIDGLQEQILRQPRVFPKLYLNKDVIDIDGFQYDDFKLEGYTPDSVIKMKMAV